MLYFRLDSGDIVSSKDVVRTAEIAYGYNIDCTDDEDVRRITERMVGIDHEIVDDIDTLIEQLLREGRIFKATQVYRENNDCTLGDAHLYVESVAAKMAKPDINSIDDPKVGITYCGDTDTSVYTISDIQEEVLRNRR